MRGNKLQAGVNYTSGAVWGGIEAQQIGLADELGHTRRDSKHLTSRNMDQADELVTPLPSHQNL